MRLHGYEVPERPVGQNVRVVDSGNGIVPEVVTAGSAAWQRSQKRALERSAHRRRN